MLNFLNFAQKTGLKLAACVMMSDLDGCRSSVGGYQAFRVRPQVFQSRHLGIREQKAGSRRFRDHRR